ncbi:predicted membrane protein [Coriobacteriaceae bacterium EMTCatB1]|nr:predicted membrane protein [Coriobacteriaceae bacterium EMTCatB1]
MAFVFFVAFALIFVGELADKSQLLALVLASRFKAWQVIAGLSLSTFVVHVASVAVGQGLGSLLPEELLSWLSGLMFVGFGVWTLRGDEIDEEGNGTPGRLARFGPVLACAAGFFLAEVGDKTQIMTMAIAADPGAALLESLRGAGAGISRTLAAVGIVQDADLGGWARFWGVTLGSTLGMVSADVLAIVVGRALGTRLPERQLRYVSALIFVAFGLLTIGLRVAAAMR